MKWVTVNDMYDVKGTATKMLSSFNADFWNDYNTNYTYYDRLFRRMFGSFRFFDQLPLGRCEELTDEHKLAVQEEFTDAVYDYLMANAKKYSELYRVNVVDDNSFSIVDNYNVTETKTEEGSRSGTDNIGTKTDTDTNVYGAATDTNTRIEGERVDEIEKTHGSREDTDAIVQGEQENSRLNEIAGFNSVSFSDDNQSTETLGEREDSLTHTQGSQTDVENATRGEQTITESKQVGSRSDTLTHAHGAQENTFEHETANTYSLHRVGNIGVKTATEVMHEHVELWSTWEFYTYIFKELCAELLLI